MGLWSKLEFGDIPEKEVVTYEFKVGVGYEITVLRDGKKERMVFRGYINGEDIIYTKTKWVRNGRRVTKRKAVKEYKKAEKYIYKHLKMFYGKKFPYVSAIKKGR